VAVLEPLVLWYMLVLLLLGKVSRLEGKPVILVILLAFQITVVVAQAEQEFTETYWLIRLVRQPFTIPAAVMEDKAALLAWPDNPALVVARAIQDLLVPKVPTVIQVPMDQEQVLVILDKAASADQQDNQDQQDNLVQQDPLVQQAPREHRVPLVVLVLQELVLREDLLAV
jgi:hypothetical protein